MGSGQLKGLLALVGLTLLAGCTMAQRIDRPDGGVEYSIMCGSGTSWSVCYKRAREECPQGFNIIDLDDGPNRKVMQIACK